MKLYAILLFFFCSGCSYITDELYIGSTPGKRGNRRNTIYQETSWKFAPKEYWNLRTNAYSGTYPWAAY